MENFGLKMQRPESKLPIKSPSKLPLQSDSSVYASNLTAGTDLIPKTKSSVLNPLPTTNSEPYTEQSEAEKQKKLNISKQRSEKASLQPRNSLGQFVKVNRPGSRQVNTWVEFQKIHKGKYTRQELSKMYKEEKKKEV